ncbi:hypothetical protein AV530_017375 [Patagioenas fasciata monilis]|uniref:Reverse transcriptase domain-containing protein n=1 Tax=Patagioenas fasciata monilis TaxID=372326 RepID=A0A1V4JFW2_PATFA|nr:hypothetical protein AV530_017375 [Patagioenas fasciata monilis]
MEEFASVDEDWVREQLGNLDIHKSMGLDGIHPQVLKELAEVIAGPHSIIFAKSWEMGEVPEDWRKANVIPVFKKDKKEDPGSYRPVGHTSIPGKVMEQLVLGAISKHIKDKRVIRGSQHGFTKGKSCLTNLIAFYEVIMRWVDDGRAVDVVYFDFSNAFDTVSHSIPTAKLRECNLDDQVMIYPDYLTIHTTHDFEFSDQNYRYLEEYKNVVSLGWADELLLHDLMHLTENINVRHIRKYHCTRVAHEVKEILPEETEMITFFKGVLGEQPRRN